jgi:hypothetical protein
MKNVSGENKELSSRHRENLMKRVRIARVFSSNTY